MSRLGLVCASGAVVLGVAAITTWPRERAGRPMSAAGAVRGADLFRAKGCASCHTGPDSAAPFGGFPPLDDAPSWAGTRRPGLDARSYLTESMRTPGAFVSPAFAGGAGPTSGMPTLALSDTEITALVAYLLAT